MIDYIDVTNLDDSRLDVYTKLNEKQLKKYHEPNGGIFICESEKVILRALDKGYEPISFFIEESKKCALEQMNISYDVPAFVAPYELMKDITGYSLTGGMLAEVKRKPLTNAPDFIKNHSKIVILDDVENPTNVGAIFRSAAALGADGILLTRGCADPLYRRATRVSMGTVFQVDWTYCDEDFVNELHANDFSVMAMALRPDSISLDKLSIPKLQKRAVILGNEDRGVSEEILRSCDNTVIIPMSNEVDSLNVAAASAVAFWEIFKK